MLRSQVEGLKKTYRAKIMGVLIKLREVQPINDHVDAPLRIKQFISLMMFFTENISGSFSAPPNSVIFLRLANLSMPILCRNQTQS